MDAMEIGVPQKDLGIQLKKTERPIVQGEWSFDLILVDKQESVVDAWRKHFEKLPSVQFVHNRFEMLTDFDCMVSAANSFGLMDVRIQCHPSSSLS